MADITMCSGKTEQYVCPKRKTCYRFTAPENKHWQAWFCFEGPGPFDETDGECGYYWPIEIDNSEKK